MPEFLENANGFDLGQMTHTGEIVNDVILSSEGEEFRRGIYKMHFYLKNSPF